MLVRTVSINKAQFMLILQRTEKNKYNVNIFNLQSIYSSQIMANIEFKLIMMFTVFFLFTSFLAGTDACTCISQILNQ